MKSLELFLGGTIALLNACFIFLLGFAIKNHQEIKKEIKTISEEVVQNKLRRERLSANQNKLEIKVGKIEDMVNAHDTQIKLLQRNEKHT